MTRDADIVLVLGATLAWAIFLYGLFQSRRK